MTRHRPSPSVLDFDAILGAHERHFRTHERQHHVALVQNPVEAQVVQQRARHAAGLAREVHRGAGDPMRRVALDHREKVAHRHLLLRDQPVQRAPAFLPRGHQHVRQHRDGDRQPAAVVELQQVREEERGLDHDDRSRAPPSPVDGAALCRTRSSMITRMLSMSIVLEIAMPYAPASALEDWNTTISVIGAREQHPVQRRHVHLADLFLGGMTDAQARQVTEIERLARDREHAGDDRLRRDHRRGRRQHDQQRQQPRWAPSDRTGWRSRSDCSSSSAPWPK